MAPYYRAHLAAMGLPMQVTVAQLQPQLQAAGIDVNRALADVLPRLTPDESKLLSATLARPVALQYFFFADGLVSIEPKTGALIDVHAQREGVSVRPDLSGVAALQPLLDKYAAIPSVKALSDGLAASAARPPQVAQELRYRQTVPSSLRAADKARSQGRQMTVVTWWVPGAMVVVGLAPARARSDRPAPRRDRGTRPLPSRTVRSRPTRLRSESPNRCEPRHGARENHGRPRTRSHRG